MTRFGMATVAVLAAAVLAGCGGDGPSDPGTTLTLSIVSGNNQVGAVGIALPAPFVVLVEDQAGNPVSGQQIVWALASAAGPNWSLSANNTSSGTDGRTSVSLTLGDAVGTYEVRASVSGSSVTFTAEATASGALSVVSGSGQVGVAGTQAGQPLVVKAVGTGGAGVSGVEVTFEVTQSAGAGAAVSPAVATTGSNGEAFTTLTFGNSNGSVSVGATANGSTVSLSGYACGGDASASTLDLQPGEDSVITGADLACLQLPGHSAGAEYEIAVTPLPQALGFNDMRLAVAGGSAASPAPAIASPTQTGRASFSLLGETSETTAWRDRQYEWDMQLREMEKPLRPQIQANAIGGSSFGLMAAAPLEGDIMDFGFSCVEQSQFPNTPTDITVEVVSVSSNAVIMEDTLSRGAFTQGEYDAIAQNFDDVIIGTDTLYFGAPADVTGDIAPGQVVIVYTQGVNQMTEDYSDGFIAGFFCPLDLGLPPGNHAKMFYLLVPDPDGDYTPGSSTDGLSKDQVLRITDNTVAHELQHLINAQVGTGAAGEVWFNEGLSHTAEEVVGHAAGQASGLANFAPGNDLGPADLTGSQAAVDVFNTYYAGNWANLAIYLVAPGDTAALLNSVDPLGLNTFRMRGANWSFVRYLLDRFGAPATEWQLTRQLITNGAMSTRQAITNVFGVPFNELAADWAAMFTVEDRSDLGGPVRPTLELTSYQLRAVYDAPNIGGVLSPTGDWPLTPAIRSLGQPGTVDMDLFTGTSSFVTLRATSASSGSGLRLMEAGSGADVSSTIMPYMAITRTK